MGGVTVVHAAFRAETLREVPRADRFCSFLEEKATSTAFRMADLSPLKLALRVKNSSLEAKLLDRRGRVCTDEKREPEATVDEVLLKPSNDALGAGKLSVALDAKILKSPDAYTRKMVSSCASKSMTWSARFSNVTSILAAAAAVRGRVSSATMHPRAGPADSRTSNSGEAPKNWNVLGSMDDEEDGELLGSGTVKAF